MAPSSQLIVAVAALGIPAALLIAVPGLARIGYGLIAAIAVIALADALLSRRRLEGISLQGGVARMWKDRAGIVEVTLRNRSGQAAEVAVAMPFPPEIQPAGDVLRTLLPADEHSRVAWTCTPRQRGHFVIDRCAIERRSPLGLWLSRRMLPVEVELRVYPNLAAERKTAPAFFRRGRLGVHGQRQIGKGREFEKLREYAPGDSFDEIDWKATARRGHPITRVFQIERTQEVYLVLDASRLTARAAGIDPNQSILERNVTATLLLALAAEKQGDLFGLITFSDRVHDFVRARNGKVHYSACREALYTLQPRAVAPDFDELFSFLRLRLRRRALLVILTELDDPVIAESFLTNVGLLRQHLILVGVAQPPDTRPIFENPDVENSGDVYRELAGHIRWSKLRTLAKALTSQGVRFSLLNAETLGPQLASLYIDLKQRQAL